MKKIFYCVLFSAYTIFANAGEEFDLLPHSDMEGQVHRIERRPPTVEDNGDAVSIRASFTSEAHVYIKDSIGTVIASEIVMLSPSGENIYLSNTQANVKESIEVVIGEDVYIGYFNQNTYE